MILALAGGVGGAKLADGLARVLSPEDLTVVVNTGDDFEHFGLHISPDLDTVMYTLAGMSNPATGWGRENETWQFMDAIKVLGGPTWFQLGDRDLATHAERTRRLASGESLSVVTESLCRQLGIACTIAPMTDAPVRTFVRTAGTALSFQHYFVREGCEPRVEDLEYRGASSATPSLAFQSALSSPQLQAIVICPSNPFLSIAPLLEITGVRSALSNARAVIAVSPIVAGTALKGPAAKIMNELGLDVSAFGIARYYGDVIDVLIIDRADAALAPHIESLGIEVVVVNTVMRTTEDRATLARVCVEAGHRSRIQTA